MNSRAIARSCPGGSTDDVCSTPFGDIDEFTSTPQAGILLMRLCSTPFGDIDEFTLPLTKSSHEMSSGACFHACGQVFPMGLFIEFDSNADILVSA